MCRRIKVCGLLVALVATLTTSCGYAKARWQEEVQLQDGTIITVVREARPGEKSGEISTLRHTTPMLEETVTIKVDPVGPAIRWHGPHRRAVVVDRVGTQWWVVAELTTPCLSPFENERAYQAYVWRGTEWEAVNPKDAPPFSKANLLLRSGDYEFAKTLKTVSLQDKALLDKQDRRYYSKMGLFELTNRTCLSKTP